MGTRECNHICDESSPGIGEAGKTGEWRILTPIIDYKKCLPARSNKPTCFLCWLYCPEAVITKGMPPSIDLEYCKGCGICSQVCPVQAIVMQHEKKA